MNKSREPTMNYALYRPKIKGNDSTDDEQSPQKCCNKKFLRINKTKYKTEMCKNFSEMGYCPYREKCQFAHGDFQICRMEPPSRRYYRTRKCHSFWTFGVCNYGSRCQFSHYELADETINYLEICKLAFANQTGNQSKLLKVLGCQN